MKFYRLVSLLLISGSLYAQTPLTTITDNATVDNNFYQLNLNKADINTVVDKTSTQVITGTKTFTGPVYVSTITATLIIAQQLVVKNYILNGSFDIWQRSPNSPAGISTTGSAYGADHWRTDIPAGSSFVGYRSTEPFTVGQTEVEGNPTQYMHYQMTTGGTSMTTHYLGQAIENVRTLQGGKATLSFYAKAAAGADYYAFIRQNFGTGGSTAVDLSTQTFTVTTSWQKFSLTFDIPSITGKTIGSGSYLLVNFKFPVNATFSFDIAQVQLEKGPVASAYVVPDFAETLQKCMRYYEKSCAYSYRPGSDSAYQNTGAKGQATATNIIQSIVSSTFKVEKYATPTMAIYSGEGATYGFNYVRDDTSGGAVAATPSTWNRLVTTGFQYITFSGTPLTATRWYVYGWTAESEIY